MFKYPLKNFGQHLRKVVTKLDKITYGRFRSKGGDFRAEIHQSQLSYFSLQKFQFGLALPG
jgi:hypothetical protein